MSPATNQARTHILKLGQFYLELAFVSAGALGENVENQTRAVNHATLENAFEVTFLTGCEDVIENHQVDLFGFDQVA